MGPSLQEQFDACVFIIHNLPKRGPVPSSYAEKLHMYSLYKQATLGKCEQAQPAFWNVVERYKWDAWQAKGDMSKDEAMTLYVENVQQKIDYVVENYNFLDWLKGEDYDRLEPILREKFAIIDRELIKKDGSSTQVPSPPMENPVEDAVVSDNEYCDAPDSHEHDSISRTSSFSVHNGSARPHSLRVYCARLDIELRNVASILLKMSESLEHRHSALMKLLKNGTVYICAPQKMSWKAIIFFFFWPFVAHWLMRYYTGQVTY